MNRAEKMDRPTAITIVGLIGMLILTATKVMPSSQIAGYSVFVGIACFFLRLFRERMLEQAADSTQVQVRREKLVSASIRGMGSGIRLMICSPGQKK